MKYVYALIVASLLMIAFGVYLISQQSTPEPEPATQPPRDLGVIPAPVPKEQSNSEVPEVTPERGTEDWCDFMLQKANDLWSEEDTKTFADKCIFQ